MIIKKKPFRQLLVRFLTRVRSTAIMTSEPTANDCNDNTNLNGPYTRTETENKSVKNMRLITFGRIIRISHISSVIYIVMFDTYCIYHLLPTVEILYGYRSIKFTMFPSTKNPSAMKEIDDFEEKKSLIKPVWIQCWKYKHFREYHCFNVTKTLRTVFWRVKHHLSRTYITRPVRLKLAWQHITHPNRSKKMYHRSCNYWLLFILLINLYGTTASFHWCDCTDRYRYWTETTFRAQIEPDGSQDNK